MFILIKGAGDLASGVAYRLKRAGLPLIMTELPTPLFVRRAVCFGEAVYAGTTTVEGITARRVTTLAEALTLAPTPTIPIMVAPHWDKALRPMILIDAIMAKVNTGTDIHDASQVIALGPGFTAGVDCHAIIETQRGHHLGRVLYEGSAEPNTHTPGQVAGYGAERVLRAPGAGYVLGQVPIGDTVTAGQLLATVSGQEVRAAFPGVLRGLIHPQVEVKPGDKIGDLDPRGVVAHCFTISDKALAIGGGALEAVLHYLTTKDAGFWFHITNPAAPIP